MIVSMWGVDLVAKSIGPSAPFFVDFSVDRTVVAFCVLVSVATGVLFGLLPALRASSPDVHTMLKETSTTVQRSHTRGLLVIGELALAMVLLAGAGVLAVDHVRREHAGPSGVRGGRFASGRGGVRRGVGAGSTRGAYQPTRGAPRRMTGR